MRVTAYVPLPATGPSTRYRVDQLAGPLADRGIDVTLAPFVDEAGSRGLYRRGVARKASVLAGGLRRRAGGLDAPGDVALVHRELAPVLNGPLLARLRASGAPIVYDFDDAVYLPAPGAHPVMRALRRPGAATRAFCRAATAVMAGNATLAAWAREARGGGEDVHVVPTVVDTERFRPAPGAPDGGAGLPTLGWVGTHSTLPYLEALEPALARLRERRPFRLVVVADRAPRMALEHTFVTWTPDVEVSSVRELDVGLYPLPRNPWTLGKCGFKAIQYMACGVPVVASPVGVLETLVTPGRTGCLADGDAAWERCLEGLLDDPAARRAMGERARERVVADYSVRAVVDRVAAILRGAASSGPPSSASAPPPGDA